MVSARSTVSIARTTPAQKPRGEQSTIFRGGLACMDVISDRITLELAGRNGRLGLTQFVKGLGTGFKRCQGRLDHNAVKWNCIMVSSPCLSMNFLENRPPLRWK